MKARLFGWWRFAEAVAAGLCSPSADIAQSDAAACAVIRHSRLFAAVDGVRSTIDRSWHSSRARLGVKWVARPWCGAPANVRIRLAGVCIFVAAATVLLLQQAAGSGLSSHDGPLVLALPLLSGVAGLTIAGAADPMARAWKAKRER